MARVITVAAAQLGPIARADGRPAVVARLIALMREARSMGAELVVYPELALTTFFPRWWIEDPAELDAFYEREMPGPQTRPLFEEATRLGIGFHLGYAELAQEAGRQRRYNTAILVDRGGTVLGKYRKIHLPGHAGHEPWRAFQHLEKRYFDLPDPARDGFRVWRAFGGNVGIAICNDRRWPETYRVMGLQGVELVLIGYNTPMHNPPAPDHDALSLFHNHLAMQAGAYQNGTWVVGVAKAGMEEGCHLIGGSAIIAPSGEIVAQCSGEADELAVARVDLDRCRSYQTTTFNFALHRQPQYYRMIVERKGAEPPAGD